MVRSITVFVVLVALLVPYLYVQQDPDLADQLDFSSRYATVTLVAAATWLLWFITRNRYRTLLCMFLLLACAAVLFLLKQPGMSEKLIRFVVAKAKLPPAIFDHFQVVDDTAWWEVLTKGNLGIAEAWMHGKAKVEPLPLFLALLNGTSIGTQRSQGADALSLFVKVIAAPLGVVATAINQQTQALSRRVTEQHYDAGNDLYEVMLGPSMAYTCAYWKNATTLDEAQTDKFDLVYRKLELPAGKKVKIADLGMGWGTLASYVHKKHAGNADVTGVSLSKEQVKWAKEHLSKPGLNFLWMDYRDYCREPANHGVHDRVYSIGMLEHVGFKNYGVFFRCLKTLLKPDGLALVHTIGEPDFVPAGDPFLDKYIFPGVVIPVLSSLTPAFENDFILEDFQNFGHDYARTLAEWAVNAEKFFKEHPGAYTVEFQRMWIYYLKMCEALFELRINQLWHFVLSPRPTHRTGIDRQL